MPLRSLDGGIAVAAILTATSIAHPDEAPIHGSVLTGYIDTLGKTADYLQEVTWSGAA